MNKWICLIAVSAALLSGCQVSDDNLQRPTSSVSDVWLEEQTPRGVRLMVRVEVDNPNDIPLPVTKTDFSLTVKDVGTFEFADQPPVALPPNGTQTIELAAAFGNGERPTAGHAYTVRGDVTYEPPGEIRKLLTEYRVPLPSTPFSKRGHLASPDAANNK